LEYPVSRRSRRSLELSPTGRFPDAIVHILLGMATCPNCGNGLVARAKFCPECGKPVGARLPTQEFRIVTVVFCDVVKSTDLERTLDPQPMQRLMDRYGQAVRQTLGDRGASVGKRHGDGFMAAFGVAELHEDDALRAVRAAAELRAALDVLADEVRRQRGLEFHVRLGINTGNVLVRDAGSLEEELTGTPVNLAKRFEEVAGPGEILLGEETYRLVADAVKAEELGPLTIKGVAEPQSVWRLREVLVDRPGRARRPIAPMVGRGREQELLLRLFERAADERTCHLVSVLGSAGVGKSRLVDEFVSGLGNQASVLRGHCPAFGDSVTMWPMVEVVRQAAGIAPEDSPEQAKARLADLLGGEERGTLVTERLAQLLGFGHDTGLPEDTYWALQRLLETLARRRPLVLVIDDLQWADPILLDAVEHVAEFADAPLVLLCMARQDELFARRGHWPGGKANALSFLLSPLPEREGEQLVVHLLGGRVDQAVQAHIIEWAQGFPLLVEELVNNLRDEGRLRLADGRWTLQVESEEATERQGRTVPTSIHTLLLARLDRLGPRGRAVIEPAAVVGQQFHLGDIEALHPEAAPSDLADGLQELVRLDLIRPDHGPTSAPLPPNSGAGYRFRHATIKTVAYERLPDDRRAELHERYADWLERETENRRSQFDEIVGHHFHEAFRYTSKLDPAGDHTRELAMRAGERYATAGQRAAVRGDTRLVQAWLGRAVRLLPAEHPVRLAALPPLAEAQQASGKLADATRAYQELARSASAVGNEGLALHATIGRLGITAVHEPRQFLREGRDEVELAIAAFDRLGDRLGLAKAWHLLAYLDWTRGRLTQAEAAAERARALAREARDPGWEANAIGMHCLTLYWGPLPLERVERRSREALAEAERSGVSSLAVTAYRVLARVAAHRGDLDEARRFVEAATAITREEGSLLPRAVDCISRAMVDMLAGDLVAAEETLRAGYRQLEEMGGTGPRVNVATLLARVLLLRGRNDDAEELTRTCERLAAPDQADAQVKWRSIRAIAMARRGELGEAERLAREAVYLAGKTDQLDSRAEAHLDLAEVLLLGGRGGEAAHELDRAISLYKEKGHEVGERNARRLLARARR
jgi:class 3 adenylate cyclase/tetratricopeptide (TPR) repeat protein